MKHSKWTSSDVRKAKRRAGRLLSKLNIPTLDDQYLEQVKYGQPIPRDAALRLCARGLVENTGWWSGWRVTTPEERWRNAPWRIGWEPKMTSMDRFVQMYKGPIEWPAGAGEIRNGPLPYSGTTWVGKTWTDDMIAAAIIPEGLKPVGKSAGKSAGKKKGTK